MNANRDNTLKLRKHSIRKLTLSELSVVHGGYTSGGGGARRTASSVGCRADAWDAK
jgi:hypothetical protein